MTLRLGTVGDGLRYITDSYNTQSDGTRVQEIDYTLGGTLSVQDALIRLTADIASGEGPDMAAHNEPAGPKLHSPRPPC